MPIKKMVVGIFEPISIAIPSIFQYPHLLTPSPPTHTNNNKRLAELPIIVKTISMGHDQSEPLHTLKPPQWSRIGAIPPE